MARINPAIPPLEIPTASPADPADLTPPSSMYEYATAVGAHVLRGCGTLFSRAESLVPEAETLNSVPIDPAEAAERIKAQSFARQAPRFLDQVADETRTNTFEYDDSDGDYGTMTEHEGLVELHDFLQNAGYPFFPNAYGSASMLENLTFIGEKEFAEGAAGLAAYWKKLLNDDPELQLCVVAQISAENYHKKSDAYLMEQVLKHFTNQELRSYRRRLLLDPKRLTADPAKVRVVMVDDWIISGQEMTNAYSSLTLSLDAKYYDRVEIHLLAASQRRLQKGLPWDVKDIPIIAYFRAHEANGPVHYRRNNAYISGTHSSVDYDFRGRLDDMAKRWLVWRIPRPALTNVVRDYRGLHRFHARRAAILAA